MNKLEDILIKQYNYTRSKALYLIKNKMIYVNNIVITSRLHIINLSDEIIVKIPKIISKIIWHNENLAIVYKPPGMCVERCNTSSFADSILQEDVESQLQLQEVYPLHRLDKETTGIIAVALNQHAYNHYKPLMQSRKFTKGYKAFYANEEFTMNAINHFECTHGKLIWSSETQCLCDEIVEYSLKTIHINETFNGIRIAQNGNKTCETLIKPIHNGYNCILITGRTHQIRLTMKSMKQTIAGDKLYGNKNSCNLQLFAYYIDIHKDFIL